MFLDYKGIKLDINNRKIAGKTQNILVIKQHAFK